MLVGAPPRFGVSFLHGDYRLGGDDIGNVRARLEQKVTSTHARQTSPTAMLL
jgi:hypothetical protein